MKRSFTAAATDAGQRLDVFLAEKLAPMTRSHIQKLIKDGMVSVGGTPARGSRRLLEGELIEAEIPEPKDAEILPEEIPLDILYEDDDVILINKPKGLVVHPAAGHEEGTLVNALMHHCRGGLSGINGVLRPGIVHRIDRDTTGVMIACKNDLAHNSIAEHLKEDEGTVDAPIGRDPLNRKKMKSGVPNGKRAVTHYRVLERFRNATYVECVLETGRTHQIRVHMASIGHPLLGDQVYGPQKNPWHLEGQALHAMTFGFVHPTTGEYMEFSAPLPEYFEKLLASLRAQCLALRAHS